MGPGPAVKKRSIASVALSVVLLGCAAAWTNTATAGQASTTAGDPKRPYGAVDVIMYQTSW